MGVLRGPTQGPWSRCLLTGEPPFVGREEPWALEEAPEAWTTWRWKGGPQPGQGWCFSQLHRQHLRGSHGRQGLLCGSRPYFILRKATAGLAAHRPPQPSALPPSPFPSFSPSLPSFLPPFLSTNIYWVLIPYHTLYRVLGMKCWAKETWSTWPRGASVMPRGSVLSGWSQTAWIWYLPLSFTCHMNLTIPPWISILSAVRQGS